MSVGGMVNNRRAFATQRQTLMDAEAMLFVDHGEPKVVKDYAFLK